MSSSWPAVASEFVATSISSSRLPQSITGAGLKLPYIKLAEARWHGYLRCTATPQAWRTDLTTVDTVAQPEAKLSIFKSFAVEPGRPGPQPA